MKAITTNKEIKRIYFDAGSINSIPGKVEIEVELIDPIQKLAERKGFEEAKRIDTLAWPFLKKLTLEEYQEFNEFVNKKLCQK